MQIALENLNKKIKNHDKNLVQDDIVHNVANFVQEKQTKFDNIDSGRKEIEKYDSKNDVDF